MDYLPLSVCCFGFGAHGTVLWAMLLQKSKMKTLVMKKKE